MKKKKDRGDFLAAAAKAAAAMIEPVLFYRTAECVMHVTGSQYRARISFSIKFPEKSLKRIQETDKINMYRRGCISLASMPLNDFI